MRVPGLVMLLTVVLPLASCQSAPHGQATSLLRFGLFFPQELSTETLDGRVFLMISTSDEREPRFQINDSVDSQQVFGIDVEVNPAAPRPPG